MTLCTPLHYHEQRRNLPTKSFNTACWRGRWKNSIAMKSRLEGATQAISSRCTNPVSRLQGWPPFFFNIVTDRLHEWGRHYRAMQLAYPWLLVSCLSSIFIELINSIIFQKYDMRRYIKEGERRKEREKRSERQSKE